MARETETVGERDVDDHARRDEERIDLVCDARGILHGAQRSVVGADGGDGRVDDVDAA
jgi:hypothetical protein